MYIRLDELMQYIDSYEKAYFNTHTFEMKYAHELAKNLDIDHWAQLSVVDRNKHNYEFPIDIKMDEWIILPKIDYDFIKNQYIQLKSKVFKNENLSFDDFHKKLYENDLYDDWVSYLNTQIKSLARDFCEINNIAYR